MRGRILAVGLAGDLLEKIDPMLNRAYFTVDRVPRGDSGLVLSDHVPFDLVLLGHPLPDMPVATFLAAVRRKESPSAGSHVLLLASEGRLAELDPAVRRAANDALSVDEPRRILEEVAARLLHVAPRLYTRLPVRLEVRLQEGAAVVTTRTENVSEAGMLVRTDDPYPVGTRAAFEISLPGDPAPVRGDAVVARHAVPGVEGVSGVGMRFLGLSEADRERLKAHLERGGPVN